MLPYAYCFALEHLQAETQHETSSRQGYIVEMAGGLLLTAWAQPSAAMNWALALEVALRATGMLPGGKQFMPARMLTVVASQQWHMLYAAVPFPCNI
jgi:hypothetical protein